MKKYDLKITKHSDSAYYGKLDYNGHPITVNSKSEEELKESLLKHIDKYFDELIDFNITYENK